MRIKYSSFQNHFWRWRAYSVPRRLVKQKTWFLTTMNGKGCCATFKTRVILPRSEDLFFVQAAVFYYCCCFSIKINTRYVAVWRASSVVLTFIRHKGVPNPKSWKYFLQLNVFSCGWWVEVVHHKRLFCCLPSLKLFLPQIAKSCYSQRLPTSAKHGRMLASFRCFFCQLSLEQVMGHHFSKKQLTLFCSTYLKLISPEW